MKIKEIIQRENLIYFRFEEEQGREILSKVLHYISSLDLCYYYMIFGDFMEGYELSVYKNKYPLLEEEEGFFQLQKEDIHNTDLIYNILNSYQASCLYINDNPDFLLGLKCGAWHQLPGYRNGYGIDMWLTYINISKNDELPAWDLSRLGIEELPKPPEPPKKEGILHRLWRIIRGW